MTERAMPPTNVHAGDHAPGDIEFLYGLGAHLRAGVAMANDHLAGTAHPQVAALASQIVASHGAQMMRVDGLRARLGSATVSNATSSSGPGNSGGAGGSGGSSYGDDDGRSAEFRAAWDTAYVNDLPDSAFLYVAPGGTKDGSGRTTPRSLRYFPYRDASGKVDLPHLRNALARIPQSNLPASVKASVTGRAQRLAASNGVGEAASAREGLSECERAAPFEAVAGGDGLTLEGYAAVFNTPTLIRDYDGDFEETILPGAFTRTLERRTPVLMFNHGKHPLIGDMPLGTIAEAREDSRGLYVRARLTDNWLIQPVRDAIRDGGIRGMSFRFTVPEGGDIWSERNTKRAIRDLDSRELGPVVFPAYEPTTVQVRAALDCIDCDLTGRLDAGSVSGGDSLRTTPGNGAVLSTLALRARERERALRLMRII